MRGREEHKDRGTSEIRESEREEQERDRVEKREGERERQGERTSYILLCAQFL